MDDQQLLKTGLYQVFIFSSPLPVPFNFAVHTWVVTNKNGITNRWEVWQTKNAGPIAWGHVHKNLFSLFTGMNIFYLFTKKRFKSTLIHSIEGDENSPAFELIKFIENESPKYLFKDNYRYVPGPNSNTYVQWVINQMNTTGNLLPWNAFGKNFHF
jgi:hypothetical protein